MTEVWSWLLSVIFVTVLWLAGRPRTRKLGWALGFASEGIWLAYAMNTKQYGFVITAVILAFVYAKNWHTEAMAFDGSLESADAIEAWSGATEARIDLCEDQERFVLEIKTLEGTMKAEPGSFIIRGIKGKFYPCEPDIFAATYEQVMS